MVLLPIFYVTKIIDERYIVFKNTYFGKLFYKKVKVHFITSRLLWNLEERRQTIYKKVIFNANFPNVFNMKATMVFFHSYIW